MTTNNTIDVQSTTAKLSNELRDEELDHVVGGTEAKAGSWLGTNKSVTSDPPPSQPKSFDVFQFVQAFA